MYKTIDTVFSVDSNIKIQSIADAKAFMTANYGNKYSHPVPHISYAICPMPESNLPKLKEELESYVSNVKKFEVTLSEVKYNAKNKFYYIELSGDTLRKLHIDLTNLANKYRDNYIRTKDLERLNAGQLNEKEAQYLNTYGYMRVLEYFNPHITIGNIGIEEYNESELLTELKSRLVSVENSKVVIDHIHAVFHTDSQDQANMALRWDGVYKLG